MCCLGHSKNFSDDNDDENVQYDANGPVERRETSSLLMSTCPITMTYSETFEVTQELHKTTN